MEWLKTIILIASGAILYLTTDAMVKWKRYPKWARWIALGAGAILISMGVEALWNG